MMKKRILSAVLSVMIVLVSLTFAVPTVYANEDLRF